MLPTTLVLPTALILMLAGADSAAASTPLLPDDNATLPTAIEAEAPTVATDPADSQPENIVVGEPADIHTSDGSHIILRPVVKAREASGYGSRQLTLKTNVPGLVVAIANIGVEYEFAPRWSFEFPIYYSCWDYFGHNTKFRTFTIQPEFKYFVDSDEHIAIGAHLGVFYYNLSLRGSYRYQTHAHNEPMIGGGLSITYRTHIGKARRWGVECSAGMGVYSNKYDRYPNTPCECDPTDLSHYVDGKCICRLPSYRHQTFWGLDKLTVAITYTFDFKNLNK